MSADPLALEDPVRARPLGEGAAVLVGLAAGIAWQVWVISALALGWVAVRRYRRYAGQRLATRRLVAVARASACGGEQFETIIVGDLLAVAGRDRRVLTHASGVVAALHDPWRRLLAQQRLEAAGEASSLRDLPHPRPFLLAAAGWVGAAVGFQVHASQWWALLLVSSTIASSVVAVDAVRRRTTLVHAVALIAATDPCPARIEHGSIVDALCGLSGHDTAKLDIALRSTDRTDPARRPLLEAMARCRLRAAAAEEEQS